MNPTPVINAQGQFDWKATFSWYGGGVEEEIKKLAGKGLKAAAIHAVRRLKEALSIPAPRRRATAGPKAKWVPPGTIYYVATTKATAGAPPRKLSGTLRRSVAYEVSEDGLTARVGTSVTYGKWLELRAAGGHQWLLKTIVGIRDELATILGKFTIG